MTKHLTHIIATGAALAIVGLPVSAIAATGSQGTHNAKAHSASVGSPKCSASQLQLSRVDSQGALGTTYWDLELRNISRSTCHMIGYPGVGLVDSHSALINVLVVRDPATSVRRIELRPGQQAYFSIGYPSEVGACSSHFTAYGIQIIPPNEYQRIVMRTSSFGVCTPSAAVSNPRVLPLRSTLSLNG